MVVKNKSTPIQVRKLLNGTTLDPTQDGNDILADTSAESINNQDNPNNPMVEAFGKRFLWHRSYILERDIGGDGVWGISADIDLVAGGAVSVLNGRYHSGLHVIHPNGVKTLVGLFIRAESDAQIWSVETTDGITWAATNIGSLTGSATAFGRSIAFGSSVYWLVYGGTTALVARDFALSTTTTWTGGAIFASWLSDTGQTSDFEIHIHTASSPTRW
jgi:hypothetical protein